MTHSIDDEIEANYDFFRRRLAEFMKADAGRVAVLRSREVIGFYDSVDEAHAIAAARFPDGLYSLQPVIAEPVDLGFFSHAGG